MTRTVGFFDSFREPVHLAPSLIGQRACGQSPESPTQSIAMASRSDVESGSGAKITWMRVIRLRKYGVSLRRYGVSMSVQVKKVHSALKHGGYSATTLLPGEDPVEFEKLYESLVDEFAPSG